MALLFRYSLRDEYGQGVVDIEGVQLAVVIEIGAKSTTVGECDLSSISRIGTGTCTAVIATAMFPISGSGVAIAASLSLVVRTNQ